MTRIDEIQHSFDHGSKESDPEAFTTALAARYTDMLMLHEGTLCGRGDFEAALDPAEPWALFARVEEAAGKSGRLLHECHVLHSRLARIRLAWKAGQELFHQGLSNALRDQEVMEFFADQPPSP